MDDHRKPDSGPIRGTPYIRTTSWSASVGIGGSSRTSPLQGGISDGARSTARTSATRDGGRCENGGAHAARRRSGLVGWTVAECGGGRPFGRHRGAVAPELEHVVGGVGQPPFGSGR